MSFDIDIDPERMDPATMGAPLSSTPDLRSPVLWRPPCPDRAALTALVRELYAEGSLSPAQMRAMANSPDLAPPKGLGALRSRP